MPKFSEESVTNATGNGWIHWFSVLDRFNCEKKGHKESARHLEETHKVKPWWAQTLTIEYEVAKGIRERSQRCDALFGTDIQRTVTAKIDTCWNLFTTQKGLNTWFATNAKIDFRLGGVYTDAGGDRCEYKSIIPNKRFRMTWEHPKHTSGSVVEVTFERKGVNSVVRVSHTKIANKKEREDLKKAWQSVMDDFKRIAENT